jgi:hypothetical protein
MRRLPEAFSRIIEGEWFCVAPIVFQTPGGEVGTTPGVTYRRGKPVLGFDVAEALDTWRATGQLPPNVSVKP